MDGALDLGGAIDGGLEGRGVVAGRITAGAEGANVEGCAGCCGPGRGGELQRDNQSEGECEKEEA
ncbi:hypothetical protein IP86_02495 [Rhodopseudomonas sp. AAP120]|nr:hypothetical protein IP86_02495 [Rhodopseudomonas sp. AAP120]